MVLVGQLEFKFLSSYNSYTQFVLKYRCGILIFKLIDTFMLGWVVQKLLISMAGDAVMM